MKKYLSILLVTVISTLCCHAEITMSQCVDKALANYPMIRQYNLIASTRDIELSDINKSWLPRINTYAQGTVQNVVPSFPKTLSGVLDQMGQPMEGLSKFQYKVGLDVAQTIWDGGVSKAQREMKRASAQTQKDALDVELYAVRQRVENLYFAILLTQEQIEQNNNTATLIKSNLEKLRSMLANGTAMQSDVNMVEAQLLGLEQNIIEARSALKGYRHVLGLFIGENLNGEQLVRPNIVLPSETESNRPELRLFESRLAATKVTQRLSDTSLMPKIGLFAQAYYGYPGFDYFKSMINRDLSFNILAGIKVNWNIDSFYTRKNAARKTTVDRENILAEKDTFLFNSDMQTASQIETIDGLREVMTNDARIISLRTSVREAAESQLRNGIIDTTTLLTKITDENQAKLTARFHEIQLLQEITNLKYTLNR